MNRGSAMREVRGRWEIVQAALRRVIGIMLGSQVSPWALGMLFGRGCLCYDSFEFYISKKKRTNLPICNTSITVQLIIQTSPPKRGMSRSTVRAFGFDNPRTFVVVVASENGGV
jgi:hypothetical protein